MLKRKQVNILKLKAKLQRGSLTVEAALVMPLFLYFMIAFLYFIEIFTVQEQIQSSITKMGLNLSKTAYFYKDFPDLTEAVQFDNSIFPSEISAGISEVTDQIVSNYSLNLYAKKYLDNDSINLSCIKGGFEGIDFSYSSILNNNNEIDIILSYKANIPLKIFHLGDMDMLQRVRLRTWTGYQLTPTYIKQSDDANTEELVYVTDTGTVYHKNRECSHIKLSIRTVNGIPHDLRNDNGAKYYACESCCTGEEGNNAVYYITSDGTRYHTKRECSKLKRTVKAIPISEVGDRRPCTRCGK